MIEIEAVRAIEIRFPGLLRDKTGTGSIPQLRPVSANGIGDRSD